MAAITDLADAAAATTAGYKLLQVDRGAAPTTPNFNASQPARYRSEYSKPVTGAGGSGVGDSGQEIRATGESNAAQATADANALASLNALRRHRYGGQAGRASGASDSPTGKGGTHTVDVT